MSRLLPIVLLFGLTGCDLFDKTVDVIDGLTNPLVGLGLVVGVEETDQADLEGSGFAAGTTFSLFLADAGSVSDLDNAPIDGADVSLQDEPTEDGVEGLYLLGPDRSPAYVDGAVWSVDIAVGDEVASARLRLPVAPDFDPVLGHSAGQALSVDLSGQEYEAAIVVVLESSSGDVTYTTEPKTAREVYDLTHGNADVSIIEVPGSAFPNTNEVYVLGIAGLNHSNGGDVDGMNTALSSISSGKLVFQPVSTGVLP